MLDADLLLPDDPDVRVLQEKVVVLVDGAGEGVLDGHHPESRLALQDGLEDRRELGNGKSLHLPGEPVTDGMLAECPALPLEGDHGAIRVSGRAGPTARAERPSAAARAVLAGGAGDCGSVRGALRQPRQLLAQHRRHGLDVAHELLELLGVQRLRPVGQRLVGIDVDLHGDPVRARGNGGQRHGAHLGAEARAVAGIHDDGEMAELLHHGDGGQVQRVARGGLEGADAALAEDHVVGARRPGGTPRT